MNEPKFRRPQISLGFMLLMNVIFCVIAGAVYWASRVPAISDEVGMMLGGYSGSSAENERAVHMIFLMFCYTAPLLLAGTLATIYTLWRKFAGVDQDNEPIDEDFQ